MSKTVLVTGGAGFIGSHMCNALLEKGHRVLCIDNLSLGSTKNLHACMKHPHFQFFEEDLLDTRFLTHFFQDHAPDTIIHLAANSDIQKGSEDISVDLDKTFFTTFNLLKHTYSNPPKEWIFASSSAIYGDRKLALCETAGPLEPVSFYGAAKLACEAYLTAFQEYSKCRLWLIRFPNVVGERLTHGVIYDFIKKLKRDPSRLQILGNGKQTKPYVYVQDIISGILHAYTHATDAINTFNIGVESMTSVDTIAAIVIEEMGLTDVAISYSGSRVGWIGDVETFQYDLTKIHQLGWRASHSSDEAVRLSVRRELSQL